MEIVFFFFHDPAPTEIYTLSLHDALPICAGAARSRSSAGAAPGQPAVGERRRAEIGRATSELQSQSNLVCRLLLEKKKHTTYLEHGSTSASHSESNPLCVGRVSEVRTSSF